MAQQEGPSRLVVIQPVRDWSCAECGGSDDLLHMDDAGPLCLACADLDHLVFLRAGNTALTRRATKASSLAAVVVRWSRSRKRYERQGVLVEGHALALAEQQCLSDEDARARRRERDRVQRASADEDSRPGWRPRSRGSSQDARPRVPRPSPRTPASAAAAGSAGPQQAAPWMKTPSRLP